MSRSPIGSIRRRVASGVAAIGLAVAGLTVTATTATAVPGPAPAGLARADIAPTPVEPRGRTATEVSGDALPTVQIDSGVVWSQAVVGNTVYAGGRFSQTRPAGAQAGQDLTPRSNLLAYDLTTGELLPFDHQVNGEVKVVRASPDGTRLYIGGSFTSVDGKGRWNLAAFDIATGELLDSFRPAIGGSYVNAIAVSETNVYVGGLFTQASGVARTNLAAFNLAGNLTSWAPTTNAQVDAMVMAPSGDRVVVGGRFTQINGTSASCVGAVDAVSGATRPWAMNKIIFGGGSSGSGVMGLSTDGTYVYAAAWLQRSWYFEGVWAADPQTGALVWAADGQGDQYDVFATGSTVYSVGHTHLASTFGGWPNMDTPSGTYQFSQALTAEARGTLSPGGRANIPGYPAPGLVHWYPNWITGTATGMGQAGWSIEGNADYVVVGGEFLGVNGRLQQGLARFATSAVQPSTQGPRLSASPRNAADTWETPEFQAIAGGAQVNIRPNFDRDDRTLTYELYRSDVAAPVATTTFDSDPWLRTSQTVVLTDTSALPNTTYTYTVRAVDSDANTATSKTVTGTTGDYPRPLEATITATMSGLVGRFDASGSTPPQGAEVTSWDWDFGDGTTGSGPVVEHTYAPGTYSVTVTVRDSLGATATATTQVTASGVFAQDTFERTEATWGNAEVGGAWTTSKGQRVEGGAGLLTMNNGQTLRAALDDVNARDTDLTMGFSLEKASAGGGTFVSVATRRTQAGEYRAKLVLNADGSVAVHLTKVIGDAETALKSAISTEARDVTADDPLRLRFQVVTGDDGSTALRVRVWRAAQEEPQAWFLQTTDQDERLAGPGSVGILTYLSASSTIAPQTVRIDDFAVVAP